MSFWLIYRRRGIARTPVGIVDAADHRAAVKRGLRDWFDYQTEKPVVWGPCDFVHAEPYETCNIGHWWRVINANRRRRLGEPAWVDERWFAEYRGWKEKPGGFKRTARDYTG